MITILVLFLSACISIFLGYIFIYKLPKRVIKFVTYFFKKILKIWLMFFVMAIVNLAVQGIMYNLDADHETIKIASLVTAYICIFVWFFVDFIEINITINRHKFKPLAVGQKINNFLNPNETFFKGTR